MKLNSCTWLFFNEVRLLRDLGKTNQKWPVVRITENCSLPLIAMGLVNHYPIPMKKVYLDMAILLFRCILQFNTVVSFWLLQCIWLKEYAFIMYLFSTICYICKIKSFASVRGIPMVWGEGSGLRSAAKQKEENQRRYREMQFWLERKLLLKN